MTGWRGSKGCLKELGRVVGVIGANQSYIQGLWGHQRDKEGRWERQCEVEVVKERGGAF